jgi:hypothetical protein
MHIPKKILLFSVFFFAIIIYAPFRTTAELIEPTRTMKGEEVHTGKLSVSSEPPQLVVILDGTEIGKTPVISMDIKPGIHILRVRDSEKRIVVEPGKPLHLSWYKGFFITAPAEKKDSPKPHEEQKVKTPTAAKKTEQPSENKDDLRPLYWPLNPRGPIY